MKVLHYPYAGSNPYQPLMFSAVENKDVECVGIESLRGFLRAVFVSASGILHIHWLDRLIAYRTLSGAVARLGVFYCGVVVWRIRRKRVVWTVHNLVNHERRRVWLNALNLIVMGRLAGTILVHGYAAKEKVASKCRVNASKVRVIYHGNYDGVVKASSMDDKHRGVRYLFFGQIRAYKGVPDLVYAFNSLEGQDHRLHITGRARDSDIKGWIEREATRDSRISQKIEFVSDDELELCLAWSDVVVLPFRDILTSGSLLMALTAGRPVVAPRSGVIAEYADDRCGFLYDPDGESGLAGAMNAAAKCTHLPGMGLAARQRAQGFDWERIAEELADIYRQT